MTGPVTAPAPSIRRLGRDTLVYGLGAVLARAVSFLMLPVYTRYLRPEDYGTLQILQMVQDLTAIVLSAGAVQGVLRFYFKTHDPEERNRLITTALATLAGLNLIGGMLLTLLARPISVVAQGVAKARDLLVIAAGNFILEAFLLVPFIYLQAL